MTDPVERSYVWANFQFGSRNFPVCFQNDNFFPKLSFLVQKLSILRPKNFVLPLSKITD